MTELEKIADEDEIRRRLLDLIGSDKRLIVCYCSVGYRSAVAVNKIKDVLERPTALNLQGSIFKWANEGRRMINADGANVTTAHPFNSFYGRILRRDLWAWK